MKAEERILILRKPFDRQTHTHTRARSEFTALQRAKCFFVCMYGLCVGVCM